MKHIFRIQLYMDEKFHSRSMYRLQKTTVHSQGGASQVNRPSNPPPPPSGAHHRGHRFQNSLASWSQHVAGVLAPQAKVCRAARAPSQHAPA